MSLLCAATKYQIQALCGQENGQFSDNASANYETLEAKGDLPSSGVFVTKKQKKQTDSAFKGFTKSPGYYRI